MLRDEQHSSREKQRWLFRVITRDAVVLRVHRVTLYRNLCGLSRNEQLLFRYAALQKDKAQKVKNA